MEAITFAKNEAYSREVAFHARKGCRASVVAVRSAPASGPDSFLVSLLAKSEKSDSGAMQRKRREHQKRRSYRSG